MSEWFEYKFGDLLEVKPRNGLYKPKSFLGRGARYIKMSDIYSYDFISNQETDLIEVSHEEEINFGCSEGDLLFGRTSLTFDGVGKCALVKKLNDKPVFESNIFRIRPLKERANSVFLYYFFKSNVGREYLLSIASQTAATSIRSSELVDLKIKLPPLPTQKAIAEILSSLDDKIELNNKINQNLEALAQALFKQWFVDFEFPNENGEPYKSSGGEMIDSELGEIPKGWEVENLEKFGEVICGKTPSKADTENFGYDVPFVKIPDMHGKVFITETTESLSIKGANSQRKKLLPKGSVMVSSIATVGLVALNTRNSQTNQQINSIIPNSSILTYFLYFLCLELKPTFLNLASGGAVTLNMNTSTFKGIKVTHPDSEVLKYFHERVDPIFEQILNLQIENEQLISLRDTLLPKLISGELEVNESLLEPTF